MGYDSICCLIAEAMAGTNVSGFKSRSSQRISENISGVISFSEIRKEARHHNIARLHLTVLRVACPLLSLSLLQMCMSREVSLDLPDSGSGGEST